LLLSTTARTSRIFLPRKFVHEHILGIMWRGARDWTIYINEEEIREPFFNQTKG
ncbi:hypothetical protein HOY80DRAFT_887855, partial [Tuber brumale]